MLGKQWLSRSLRPASAVRRAAAALRQGIVQEVAHLAQHLGVGQHALPFRAEIRVGERHGVQRLPA